MHPGRTTRDRSAPTRGGFRPSSRLASGRCSPLGTAARRPPSAQIHLTRTRGSGRRARTLRTFRRTESGRVVPRVTGSRGSPGDTTGRATQPRALSGLRPPWTRFEAGDKCSVRRDGRWKLLVRTRRQARTVPLPSAARLYKFETPGRSRSDVKMTRRPSGVQCGSASMPGAKVKALSVSRARSQIQMSLLS